MNERNQRPSRGRRDEPPAGHPSGQHRICCAPEGTRPDTRRRRGSKGANTAAGFRWRAQVAGEIRHPGACHQFLRAADARLPDPDDDRVHRSPGVLVRCHRRSPWRVRQHLQVRHAGFHPCAGKQVRLVSGTPRQRGVCQFRKPEREPPHRDADDRFHPRYGRPACQWQGQGDREPRTARLCGKTAGQRDRGHPPGRQEMPRALGDGGGRGGLYPVLQTHSPDEEGRKIH